MALVICMQFTTGVGLSTSVMSALVYIVYAKDIALSV